MLYHTRDRVKISVMVSMLFMKNCRDWVSRKFYMKVWSL